MCLDESKERLWKIICSNFGLTAQQGFRGSYLLAPWPELGLSHVQIEGIVEAHNFGSQTFAIRGHLGPRICTERSCCLGLREYLSGWVDLIGKPPSPCHTCFPKKTKCITICMPESSFTHIVTSKWIQKQYHVWKRKITRDLRLILETKAPNITGSRLGVAYA
jgi:hypothetical protein